jgi:membrane protease YdiL (CAAX protease family)
MVVCAHLGVGIILGVSYSLFGREPKPILFWSSLLLFMALLAVFKILTALLEEKPLASIGFGLRGRWKTELGIGLALGAAAILAIAGLEWTLGLARFSRNPFSGWQVLAGGVYYFVLFAIAAAAEEMTFRGYPFQRLVESIGAVYAVAILSVVFGIVHLENPSHSWLSTLNTVLIGIPLAVAYLRTRSLWLPFGIHFAWNFTMGFAFGLPVSGIQFSSTLLRVDVHGFVQMTGGNYGPEGSWLATGVIALIALYIFFSQSIYTTPEMQALAIDAPEQASVNPGPGPGLLDTTTNDTKMVVPGVK